MPNPIGEAVTKWDAFFHHPQHATNPQEQPQEANMTTSKLSAAREAISAIADNPLIDAIAEAGIGKWMHPAEIQDLVGLWREVEHYRAQAAAPPKIDLSQQQQPIAGARLGAADLTPQQTV